MPIARTRSDTCPVSMLERYFKLAQMQGDADKYLFRGLVKTKEGHRLRSTGSISYTRVRELLKEIGLDPKEFGLTALDLVVLRLRPMLVSLTAGSSDVRMQRMDMLRIG